jgi:hypothetical protein
VTDRTTYNCFLKYVCIILFARVKQMVAEGFFVCQYKVKLSFLHSTTGKSTFMTTTYKKGKCLILFKVTVINVFRRNVINKDINKRMYRLKCIIVVPIIASPYHLQQGFINSVHCSHYSILDYGHTVYSFLQGTKNLH